MKKNSSTVEGRLIYQFKEMALHQLLRMIDEKKKSNFDPFKHEGFVMDWVDRNGNTFQVQLSITNDESLYLDEFKLNTLKS